MVQILIAPNLIQHQMVQIATTLLAITLQLIKHKVIRQTVQKLITLAIQHSAVPIHLQICLV